mgnify:CR=1 FL=1
MLFVKPCCFRGGHDDEEEENQERNEIELADNVQPRSSAMSEIAGIQMGKSNLKSIDQQLKNLGPKKHDHGFGEAFIH